jgi:Leucine-rich repeat (LRR) protein
MKTKLLIIVLLVCASFTCLFSQAYSITDSLTLLTIDDSCDASDSLNWNMEPDPGKWEGVIWNTDNPKRVVELRVIKKALTGAMDVSELASLVDLRCEYNQLTGLDVSTLTKLLYLRCNSNQLTDLDLSALTNLVFLDCSRNPLTHIDVSALVNLTTLSCYANQLTELNVSSLTNLIKLFCELNQLMGLDVSELIKLTYLDCNSNQLTILDVSALANLEYLKCSSNHLTGLDVSVLTKLNYLYCYDNQLTEIDVSALTNLTELACSNNQLTGLDVSALINLTYLNCSFNQLTSLDVSALSNLTELYCHFNQLSSLDVSVLTNLKNLYCYNNQLTQLNVSALTNLSLLRCYYNQLTFSSLATGLHVGNFEYIPQDIIFEPYSIAVDVILDYSEEALIDDTVTQFVFYKDGVEAMSNSTGLFTTTDTGIYYCQVTNAKFPGLTLTTASVTVTGASPTLELSASSLNVDAPANSTATFNIVSNTIWNVTSSQNWLTVSPESGLKNQTITVTAEENPDGTTRDATITVSGTGVTPRTVLVTQKGKDISSLNVVNNNNDILYPNPVKDKIHFNSPKKITGISVFSLSGIELIKTNNAINGIDVSLLAKGTYLIQVKTDNKMLIHKIVIE